MKQQRARFKIAAVCLFGLFFLLALYGGYSVVRYGNRWFATNKNRRVAAQKENVIAGDILDRTGRVLATTDASGARVYQSSAAARRAVVHVLGDGEGQVSNGVEDFQASYLYGFQASFPELVSALLSGESRRGDTVQLTLSASLCEKAVEVFMRLQPGKHGAVIVLNAKTGELLCEVSLPGFDPDHITDETKNDSGQPFWNRAVQALYPPGSTFKTVTAASAIENIAGVEDHIFYCTAEPLYFDEHAISDYQGEKHGSIHLQEAFAESCNKTFASIAVNLGQTVLQRTAESFGFNENFLFRDLVVENSRFPRSSSEWELAACGFGQSSIVATPMHMCLVAAAVANRGVMMEPRLLRAVTAPGGKTRITFSSQIYRTAMSGEIAARLKEYMRAVVTSGTGKRAAVSGLRVCGKTGTADSTQNGKPIAYGWFTGFADADQLPLAVCVVVENIGSKASGGSTAAPIASELLAWCAQHRNELVD
ncbi:MAG: penicillin-binding protein 2 [Clostridia bacterium]|nr:penicillin-binding protein 2 [Clostridia bacterium]